MALHLFSVFNSSTDLRSISSTRFRHRHLYSNYICALTTRLPCSKFCEQTKVDASLDAQHAARVGRLMQRRAAAESVQYIAISRELSFVNIMMHSCSRFLSPLFDFGLVGIFVLCLHRSATTIFTCRPYSWYLRN